jgi:branched-chain amino acid transport system substrate-binding protein
MATSLLLVILLVASVGCASTKPTAVKIASVGAKTGESAVFGQQQLQGMQVAVDVINKGGGVQNGPLKGLKFEIVPFDDRADPKEGATIAQRLVADKSIFAQVGNCNSAVCVAAAPILSNGKVTMVSDLCVAIALTHPGYPYVFRIYPTSVTEGKALAGVAQRLGYKSMYIFYENTDAGVGMQESLDPSFKALGGKVLGKDAYLLGKDIDFSTLITKARAANPDAVAIVGSYTEVSLIVRQSRTVGWNVPILVSSGNAYPDVFDLAGPENLHDVYFTNPPDLAASKDPQAAAYLQNFKEMFGQEPPNLSAFGYDAVMLIKQAIELGCGKREDLPTYLRKIKDYPGLTAKITFDQYGDVETPNLILLKVVGKQYVPY